MGEDSEVGYISKQRRARKVGGDTTNVKCNDDEDGGEKGNMNKDEVGDKYNMDLNDEGSFESADIKKGIKTEVGKRKEKMSAFLWNCRWAKIL